MVLIGAGGRLESHPWSLTCLEVVWLHWGSSSHSLGKSSVGSIQIGRLAAFLQSKLKWRVIHYKTQTWPRVGCLLFEPSFLRHNIFKGGK